MISYKVIVNGGAPQIVEGMSPLDALFRAIADDFTVHSLSVEAAGAGEPADKWYCQFCGFSECMCNGPTKAREADAPAEPPRLHPCCWCKADYEVTQEEMDRCMCDCHRMTAEEQKAWRDVQREPRTAEDWKDLHDTIEAYKRRLLERHRHRAPEPSAGSSAEEG